MDYTYIYLFFFTTPNNKLNRIMNNPIILTKILILFELNIAIIYRRKMSQEIVSKPRALDVFNNVINKDVLSEESAFYEKVGDLESFNNLKKEYKKFRKEHKELVEKNEKSKKCSALEKN